MSLYVKIFLLLISLLQAAYVHALEQKVLLVTGNDYAPFSDETLSNGGLATEIVVEVFSLMGFESAVRFEPWKRGLLMTRHHEVLATFPYVKDLEREKEFFFSDSLVDVTERMFVTKDMSMQYSKERDFKDKRVCRPIGYSLEPIQAFVASDEKNLWRPESLSKCFVLLSKGRVDGVPINDVTGWATISASGLALSDFSVLPAKLAFNSHHLIISKDYPDGKQIIEAFNKGLKELKRLGKLEKIYKKHIPGWPLN